MMRSLEEMPGRLRAAFAELDGEDAVSPGPGGAFSPVEQAWHLADLEREGFGFRIEALLSEENPFLPDFDGTLVAQQRNYRGRSLEEGLEAFAIARRHNIDVLKAIEMSSWSRAGQQEGIGEVTLCDIPGFMLQHDRAHETEIGDWTRARRQAR
jgi:hypothetical protein